MKSIVYFMDRAVKKVSKDQKQSTGSASLALLLRDVTPTQTTKDGCKSTDGSSRFFPLSALHRRLVRTRHGRTTRFVHGKPLVPSRIGRDRGFDI